MPKLPAKLKPLLKKKTAPAIKSMEQKLAEAADAEGMWVKDFVKFEDLLSKHRLPTKITELQAREANRLHREFINTVYRKR